MDLPDEKSAAALSLAIGAAGALDLKITVLVTPETIDAAVAESVSYRAPRVGSPAIGNGGSLGAGRDKPVPYGARGTGQAPSPTGARDGQPVPYAASTPHHPSRAFNISRILSDVPTWSPLTASMPPSTTRSMPVTQRDSVAAEVDAGHGDVPGFAAGAFEGQHAAADVAHEPRQRFFLCSVVICWPWVWPPQKIGVAMAPGLTALTRMPMGPSCIAAAFV